MHEQASYPNEYSAGPLYNLADDMNGRNHAAVESERSNSSDASEHCNVMTIQPHGAGSTFSTNQKAADLLLLSNELIESVSNNVPATMPMKGVVYKYETPNMHSFHKFPNMEGMSHQQQADDSGIGEVCI